MVAATSVNKRKRAGTHVIQTTSTTAPAPAPAAAPAKPKRVPRTKVLSGGGKALKVKRPASRTKVLSGGGKAIKALLAEEKEIMMMTTKDMNDLQLEWWKETTVKIMQRRRLLRQSATGGASVDHGDNSQA
jgi:hypothetical protein